MNRPPLGVIVTRGDVDLLEILATMPILLGWHTRIWDNSEQIDFGPFGQFLGAMPRPKSAGRHSMRTSELVYFQDDDCVTDPTAIAAEHEPGRIVCNMPQEFRANYEHQPDKLMGFGSCFERSLIRPTFEHYLRCFPIDPVLLREPGRIFTGLNQDRIKLVDVPKRDLPWATAPNRLYRQADHQWYAEEARRRVRFILEKRK